MYMKVQNVHFNTIDKEIQSIKCNTTHTVDKALK